MRAVRVIWLLSSKALVPGSVHWKKRASLPEMALGVKSRSAMGVRTARANLRLLALTQTSPRGIPSWLNFFFWKAFYFHS
ncbi:hypothetical protein BGY98DRAFT_430618 [Russula aff. rugulosa BPL654]|nr:hypothetical protein BGY98DRAFT_430618 [Russula aff. rugulosa BPL654]